MTRNLRVEGRRLIREGERILRRDAHGALADRDFNMVVRRAQEAVELVLKGALKMLGADYPKTHDVASALSEQARRKLKAVDPSALNQIEEISLWLSQARAPSFYFERDYGAPDARKACKDARLVVKHVKQMFAMT